MRCISFDNMNEGDFMESYKIGQLTKTMGVSSHLLKHYEKFDLIIPTKDHETNYRYYDFGQFGRLIQSKRFRNIGLSIKDTSDLVKGMDNAQLNETLNKHIQSLQAEIEKLQFQKQLACRLFDTSLNCDEHLNQWFIEMMPSQYILKQSDNKKLIEDNHSLIGDINLIDHAPITESILYIPKENLTSDAFNYHWSLGIHESALEDLNIKLDERFIHMPSLRAFTTYLKVEVPYTENCILIERIKALFNPFPFNCCGDIIAILVKSTCENNEQYQYFKIYIPID